MKYLLISIFCVLLAACVQEAPPYDNVRNQRAQDSLRNTDNQHNQGYYDDNGDWQNDYQNGHDHVARHDD